MPLLMRGEVPAADTWDLNPLYSSIDEWREEFTRVEASANEFTRFQGTLGQSAQRTGEALRSYLEFSRAMERLHTYAHLLSDADTSNAENLAYLDESTNLYARLSAISSFMEPELLSLPDEVLKQYLDDPGLSDVRRMLSDIVRYKPHTLSKEEENLLALGIEVFGISGRIFSQLNNADLSFPEQDVDGERRPLTHGSFMLFLKHQQREVRERAFNAYYSVFEAHKNTIAASFSGSIKKDTFLARARRYRSALHHALFGDNVEEQVYHNLIDTISRSLEPLHRYYQLRSKQQSLKPLRLYDTYVPLVADVKVHFEYSEAVDLIIDALAPLGAEYCGVLRQGLADARWVDRFENKGKRSGAYSSGCFDSYPYILLNYKPDDLGSVFTLAHEAGHSMHTWHSQRSQAYQDYRYTIFVAEVASTFNEELLMKKLREKYAGDERMTAYLITEQLDDIKGTLYRQVMFAEFERTVHELAENNKPLTVAVLREIYRGLLRKYFGPALAFGELDDLECLRIPHFYSAFYVYKYATGIAAAVSLARQVLTEGEPARERYLRFLQAGCSKYPVELLAEAGVKITEPQPIEDAVRLFNSLLDALEAITGC